MKSKCLCGNIEFEYDALPGLMGHCHCEECRRSAGAAFVTSIYINPRSHKIIKGAEFIKEYNHTPRLGRVFCGNCGSRLWNYGKAKHGSVENAPFANVTASSVIEPFPFKPQAHINLSEKAEWVEINDELEKFEDVPPMEYFSRKLQEHNS
ncbi:GFA family protein [Ketobacter sp. MCCC 1A13808]|uniref:GFA family protein n=1 Tax=Ketobacter sp. MCCC 1A13808 TaxID=2602738 RepID=UPI0012EC7C0E|nr:GFA family protein [Ketobacter sp. MCCC 1A13808]MVF14978.1 GFA family protein [Ketobacter sp. MCCC 1A13808]